MFQDEALRGEIAERAVRPLSVVVLAEVFDDDAGLGEGPELFAVEALIAEATDGIRFLEPLGELVGVMS